MALGNAFWKWNLEEPSRSPPRELERTPTPALGANPELRGAQRRRFSRRSAPVSAFAVRPASLSGATPSLRVGSRSALGARARALGAGRGAARSGGRQPAGWSTSRRGGDTRAHQRFLALRVRARPRPAAALCGSGVGARHGGGRGQAGPDPDLNASISFRAVGLAAGCA